MSIIQFLNVLVFYNILNPHSTTLTVARDHMLPRWLGGADLNLKTD